MISNSRTNKIVSYSVSNIRHTITKLRDECLIAYNFICEVVPDQ